jgi:hypothetical protein
VKPEPDDDDFTEADMLATMAQFLTLPPAMRREIQAKTDKAFLELEMRRAAMGTRH